MPRTVRAVLDAWTGGAPFGLALTGDAHRVEHVFRRLRPYAGWVWRNADAGEPPPRIVRALALCPDAAALPPAVRRLCTVVVDVGIERASGRRPAGETEEHLWRRVVSVLSAHGVRDGAIDVAACALASALVDADVDGDPVALVRAWIALAHGRERQGIERGESDGTRPADEDTTDGSDAENPDDAGDASAAAADGPPAGDDGSGDEGEAAAEDGGPDGAGDVVPREESVPPRGMSDADGASGDDPVGAPATGDLAGAHAETAGEADGGAPDAASGAAAPEPSPERQFPSAAERGDACSPDAGAPEAGIAADIDSDRAPSARAAALLGPEVFDARDRARVRTGRRAPRGATRAGTGRGRPGRIVAPERADGRIAILPTVHAALRRHAASATPGPLVITRDDVRGRLRAEPTAAHTVVVIDGSSSMGAAGAAHARRVADVALAHVYRDRGDVSVVLAAGSDASLVQARTPRISRARAALQRASAEGGGGTPLADSVRRALDEFGDAARERCRLVIVSDGQGTVDLEGRADPRTAARDLRVQLDRASARAARVVFVPLDPRGYTPLERTLAPFRAAGAVVVSD
ncbi:VWA domain-containing protein [Microbacterium testaceum]|uniref:VWA domain-containing protein n=1 Tax=Microbacterium testaceum TaxID=2033 RepID=UPI00128EA8CF|nr:VWA domain-containing protein [Microbacterium testaceum]